MFNMKNAIKPIEVNVDTKNFDVQFVRDSLLVRDKINGWSAGCLVANNTQDYYNTMNTFKQSGQKYFTMCLIKEF